MTILSNSLMPPMLCLLGKTHELREYNWGPISMSLFFDKMHSWLTQICAKPELFLDEKFMLGWIQPFKDQVDPFKEYCDAAFARNQPTFRSRTTHAIVANLRDVCDEAFHPKNQALKACEEILLKLVPTIAGGIIEDMEDRKRVAWKHLSKFGKEHIEEFNYSLSWKYSTEEMKEHMMGWKPGNSITESGLGGTTQQLHLHGTIGIANSAAVSDAQRNRVLGVRATRNEKKRTVWEPGFIGKQEPWLADCLMEAARQTSTQQNVENRDQLENFYRRRREKRRERKAEVEKKAESNLIRAWDYCQMYYKSDRIVKDENKVDEMLNSITTQKDRWEFLKNNFRAREWGLDLTQFHQVRLTFCELQYNLINSPFSTEGMDSQW